MSTQVSSNQQVHAKSAISLLAQNFAAFVFGVAVLFAIGFLPMEAAHNAAHDTRHTMAFPCH